MVDGLDVEPVAKHPVTQVHAEIHIAAAGRHLQQTRPGIRVRVKLEDTLVRCGAEGGVSQRLCEDGSAADADSAESIDRRSGLSSGRLVTETTETISNRRNGRGASRI